MIVSFINCGYGEYHQLSCCSCLCFGSPDKNFSKVSCKLAVDVFLSAGKLQAKILDPGD